MKEFGFKEDDIILNKEAIVAYPNDVIAELNFQGLEFLEWCQKPDHIRRRPIFRELHHTFFEHTGIE